MRRLGVLLMLAALLTGCDPLGKPSIPPAFGARVTDGHLQIWTGSRCVGATGAELSFKPAKVELQLAARAQGGLEIEYLTLGGPYPGLEVVRPLPEGFDWHTQESMHFGVDGGSSQWGTTTYLAEVIRGSDQHPPDTYWFEGVGWLNAAEVAAKDSKTFLGLCTPDPAKSR